MQYSGTLTGAGSRHIKGVRKVTFRPHEAKAGFQTREVLSWAPKYGAGRMVSHCGCSSAGGV